MLSEFSRNEANALSAAACDVGPLWVHSRPGRASRKSGHVRFSNRPFEVKRFRDDPPPQFRCRSRAHASLRNRLQGPSIMGFEDEVVQSMPRPSVEER